MAPETEKSKMKKISILFGISITLIASAAFATAFGSASAAPVDDVAGYNPIPFIIDDEVNMTSDSAEEWASAEDSEAAMTPLTTPTCLANGWCHYHLDASSNPYEIHCLVPEGSALNTAVGYKYEVADRVHVCTYVAGAWEERGWCDVGALNKMRIDGMNSSRDSIGIVRSVWGEGAGGAILPGADCNFNAFKDTFEPFGGDGAYLKIYGRGMYDWIYGSQFDDVDLSGEYVDGREGDDTIHLTDNEIGTFDTHTSAFGNYGADTIYGSASVDDVWADNPDIATKAQGGMDYISGGAGGGGTSTGDYLRGAWFNDTIYGGDGVDYIYGGDELGTGGSDNGDFLYGDNGDDTVYGMDGRDELHGGANDDHLYGHDNPTSDNDGMYDRCWGDTGNDDCVCDWEDVSCES
jgi:hypothetical protein